ncbi:glycosyltransferase family 2 protein [Mobilicoccus pelagius]|uniref:Putative glycosyltransferase n=1 Tax=Mobilicoccus pelagius NBRC 104925 TaxID=1089455 RepID=H5UQV4_9MICO|nr:glycosyltransferase family 2 protein [Mobilicoccus pelagius]GAB48112.1 putative glycosyltransferase [Mobilicoccus pelagius NBRC 104925]
MAESPCTTRTIAGVVCCYTLRRWDDIVAAVESLLHQERPLDEVVVVVDHNDDLLRRCHERWDGRVRIVENDGRQGLADGRNAGLRAARSEIVAFLDDDAVAAPDWSARLLESYAVQVPGHEVVGAGGFIETDWRPEARPTWWPRAFDWVVGCSYTGLPTRRAPVRNVIGANMSVLRDVALEAGGFNPDMGRVGTIPLGGEETDLYIRAAALRPGSVVLYDPAARVRHHVTADRATWSYFRRRCYAEGLTKAALSRLTRSSAALSSESSYAMRVLPVEAVRGLCSTDPRRGLAVVGGLGATAAGYVRGLAESSRVGRSWRGRRGADAQASWGALRRRDASSPRGGQCRRRQAGSRCGRASR